MRVGLIARADRTGLAAQTWSFWRAMKPAKTLVVDLSRCSGQPPEMHRYAGDPNVSAWTPHPLTYPTNQMVPEEALDRFLDDLDVVFTAETPYNLWLFHRARERKVRTVLAPNYEFLEYLVSPTIPEPDTFALPSLWHAEDIRTALPGRHIVHLPVPVDRDLFPPRHRVGLRRILHTAGTPALEDRNGTLVLIEAMRQITSPVTATIRTQKYIDAPSLPRNVHVDDSPVADHWDLYGDEDLYVMPRKFGGLCLPMQEALSVGMPVLSTDVSPQNGFLPPELLVPAHLTKRVQTRALIGIHEARPVDLARRIDWFYDHPEAFSKLSTWADEWAQGMAWGVLRPLYEAVLAGGGSTI